MFNRDQIFRRWVQGIAIVTDRQGFSRTSFTAVWSGVQGERTRS